MSNLIDLVKGHFTDELVERMGPFLGVDAAKAHKIADTVIPALLGAVTAKAGDGGVLELIKSFVGNGFDFSKVWNPAGGLVGLAEQGHPIVASLFGDQAKESVAAVAKAAGTSDFEARKALNLTAPGLLATLASSLGAGATGAGLASLLESNKDAISEKAGSLGLPFDVKGAIAGLAGLAGVAGVAAVTKAELPSSEVPEVETPAAEAPKASAKRITVGDTAEVKEAVTATGVAAAAAVGAGLAGVTNAKDVASEGVGKVAALAGDGLHNTVSGPKMGFLVPLLLIGAVVAGGYFVMKGCAVPSAELPAVATNVEAPTSAVQPPEAPPVVAAPMADTGKVEIEGGVQLDAAPDGIEHKLVDFIKSDKPVDKTTWFTFDRLYFDTAKSSLKPESEAQLKNIGAIMKAYPNVKLKIGGYTDNVGNDAANMKLSSERATATVARLVAIGVDATRLSPEGYGKEHPIADNGTAEGRKKNRRIDVRVTAK